MPGAGEWSRPNHRNSWRVPLPKLSMAEALATIFGGFGLPNSGVIRHHIGPSHHYFPLSPITCRSDHEPADSPIG